MANTATTLSPGRSLPRLLLHAEGNNEDARQEFRLVAEKFPDSEFAAEALYKSAECTLQLGMRDDAAHLGRIDEPCPKHVAIERNRICSARDRQEGRQTRRPVWHSIGGVGAGCGAVL